MFDDDDIPAGFPEHAERMLQPEERPCRLIEVLDADAADIVSDPLVEYRAQKSPVGFGRNGFRADSIVCGTHHQRQELQVLDPDVFEETVDRRRLPDVMMMNDAQH